MIDVFAHGTSILLVSAVVCCCDSLFPTRFNCCGPTLIFPPRPRSDFPGVSFSSAPSLSITKLLMGHKGCEQPVFNKGPSRCVCDPSRGAHGHRSYCKWEANGLPREIPRRRPNASIKFGFLNFDLIMYLSFLDGGSKIL